MFDEHSLQALPAQVPALWRWRAVIGCIVGCGLLWSATLIWPGVQWVGALAVLGGPIAVAATLADIVWLVARRHASYRYALDQHGLRLRQGVLIAHRTVVPAAQILYVDVSQGPIERALRLSTLRIGTLGSTHEVGPLAEADALALAENHLNRTPHDAPR